MRVATVELGLGEGGRRCRCGEIGRHCLQWLVKRRKGVEGSFFSGSMSGVVKELSSVDSRPSATGLKMVTGGCSRAAFRGALCCASLGSATVSKCAYSTGIDNNVTIAADRPSCHSRVRQTNRGRV